MIKLFLVFVGLLVGSVGALAQSGGPYYFSPSGLDTNDCLSVATPCKSIQHGVGLAPIGAHTVLNLAAGTYSGTCPLINVTHYIWIDLQGDPVNTTAVYLNCSGSGPLRWVQDHAVLTSNNLKVGALNNGITGLATRQYSVADDTNVTLSSFPFGNFYYAAEQSKINTNNITMVANIAGSAGASCGYSAVGLSSISIGSFKFGANTDSSFTGPFACGDDYSFLDFSASVFTGPGVWGGQQYSLGVAEIKRPPAGMPGSGSSTGLWSIVK